MIYQMVRYSGTTAFNEDAEVRSDEMLAKRSAISYDRPWIVQQMVPQADGSVWVLWSQLEPLRVRK